MRARLVAYEMLGVPSTDELAQAIGCGCRVYSVLWSSQCPAVGSEGLSYFFYADGMFPVDKINTMRFLDRPGEVNLRGGKLRITRCTENAIDGLWFV